MKRFKGFGARRSFEKGEEVVRSAVSKITNPQCLPGLYSPARESSRRRSVDDSRFKEAFKEAAGYQAVSSSTPADGDSASSRYVGRRRSVDDSHFKESEDLQAVRREIWKACPQRLGLQSVVPVTSSSDSFSSVSDVQSSSRTSNASAVSYSDAIQQQSQPHAGDGKNNGRVTMVGFDAHARVAGVNATVSWTFQNVVRRGDVLVLVGVMDYIRGPLGYKVQVDDQTWLGANKKALEGEIRLRTAAWQGLPGLKKLSEDAGVKVVVDVKAAARPEVAIVQEAVALGAVHVVLDKSLHNRRRRYYLERLSCDVSRMRRSGGVDSIRSLASIASDREKARVITSPTSVLMPPRPPRGITVAPPSLPPPDGTSELRLHEGTHNSSFNASLARLVQLAEETSAVASSSSSIIPAIDDADELFTIDLARRVSMLLEPEPDLMDHRRDQLAMDYEGYESDDLFSLAGDGASRRSSIAVFCPPGLQLQSARNSIARPSYDFSRSSLEAGPRLDERLLTS